jgi:hypothetical protein
MRQVSLQAFKLALALKKRAIREGRNDEISLRYCLRLAERAIHQRATQEATA